MKKSAKVRLLLRLYVELSVDRCFSALCTCCRTTVVTRRKEKPLSKWYTDTSTISSEPRQRCCPWSHQKQPGCQHRCLPVGRGKRAAQRHATSPHRDPTAIEAHLSFTYRQCPALQGCVHMGVNTGLYSHNDTHTNPLHLRLIYIYVRNGQYYRYIQTHIYKYRPVSLYLDGSFFCICACGKTQMRVWWYTVSFLLEYNIRNSLYIPTCTCCTHAPLSSGTCAPAPSAISVSIRTCHIARNSVVPQKAIAMRKLIRGWQKTITTMPT